MRNLASRDVGHAWNSAFASMAVHYSHQPMRVRGEACQAVLLAECMLLFTERIMYRYSELTGSAVDDDELLTLASYPSMLDVWLAGRGGAAGGAG